MNHSLIKASLYSIGLITTTCTMASERMEDGRLAYATACASCHENNTADTPQTGNPDDWSGRSTLWDTVLIEHAKRGYLAMPAQAGTGELSDYDIEAAAEYMLNKAHPDLPGD